MKGIGRFILSATVVAVAALGLGSAPASAQSIPVRVTNTPLPVTGAVTVGNPVTVNGTVTVGNPVTVANPVSVDGPVTVVGAVTVGNTADSPVLTRDVDAPAEEPFEASLCEGSGTLGAYCIAGTDRSPIPATSPTTGKNVKRLVVEFVSGTCQASTGTSLVNVELVRGLNGGGNGLGYYFLPVIMANSGVDNYVFSQQTRLYFSPGESLVAGVARVGPVGHVCLWAVSGYLVTQ
jgi:hypothetical protein